MHRVLPSDRWTASLSAIGEGIRGGLFLSAGLFALGMASRVPFRSQMLYHWDSVNFALAIEHYDVRLDQPQPPGYFLYVMLGRLMALLFRDSNSSLVWLSVIFSGLAVVALYWLGRVLFDRRVAVAAAVLFLTSPLFWFHGEVALSYILECFFVALIGLVCFRLINGGDGRWLLPTSAVLIGTAGGVRPNTAFFLMPLWLYSVYQCRPGWRRFVAVTAILAATVSVWALPMVLLSGGVEGYLSAVGAAGGEIATGSPFLDPRQLIANAGRLGVYTIYALMAGIPPLALYAARMRPTSGLRWKSLFCDRRKVLFVYWFVPSLLFYLVFHIRQPGHTFTFMPGLILLASAAICRLGESWGSSTGHIRLLVIVGLANSCFFLLAPAQLFGLPQMLLSTPTRQSILEQDIRLHESVAAIRANFSPDKTAILASGRDFRYPDFYLRDYQYTALSYQLREGNELLAESITTLVFFDDSSDPRLADRSRTRRLILPSGRSLLYLPRLATEGQFEVGPLGVRLH